MDTQKLSALVNHPVCWKILEEWIDERLQQHYKFMINADDEKQLYRQQGAIKDLLDLKHLREKVNASK